MSVQSDFFRRLWISDRKSRFVAPVGKRWPCQILNGDALIALR